MIELQVIQAGLYTTVQDAGRVGHRYAAVPQGGYLHALYAQQAALLLGLPPGSALLECLLTAPTLRFTTPASIAVVGADFGWCINGISIPRSRAIEVCAGDVLSGTSAKSGWIGYIAVGGQLQGSSHYGSMSSYATAGLGYADGVPLRQMQILRYRKLALNNNLLSLSISSESQTANTIDLLPGLDGQLLTTAELQDLMDNQWRISASSNRMGLRLIPQGTICQEVRISQSVPIYPGFVQLTPSGSLIVALADSQCTGGYARVGYINDAQLSKLLSLSLRSIVSFSLNQK